MNESLFFNLITIILLAGVAAQFIRRYLFFVARVSSLSMSPLLKPKQRLLTKRLYAYNKVHRGDIVIFHSHELNQDVIKRVIGLPGDSIDIRENGTVYLNQKELDEPYTANPSGDGGNFIVPKGKYFMLGDNRTISQDSRHFEDPYIAQKDMVGKVFFSCYPFHRI